MTSRVSTNMDAISMKGDVAYMVQVGMFPTQRIVVMFQTCSLLEIRSRLFAQFDAVMLCDSYNEMEMRCHSAHCLPAARSWRSGCATHVGTNSITANRLRGFIKQHPSSSAGGPYSVLDA